MTRRDTIFAPSSGLSRAAVSIIRLSGPGSGAALQALTGANLPPERRASLRKMIEPATGDLLDQAIVIWLPGPGSFTGEDQAEFHIHGGLAVRAAVLGALSRLPGCRPSEPGEFTRRAFLNNRLELTAVEGLADLIDADTEAQRRQAMRQMRGGLAAVVVSWRDRLLGAAAACEAALDFSDQDDVPDAVGSDVAHHICEVCEQIRNKLRDAPVGERLRDGLEVVIAGPPNSGKSTLINALARRDVAIVSPVPGTTRDLIEARCDLGGLPVTFVDTAGLRESRDPIEQEGMFRARQRMEDADLVIWLVSGDAEYPDHSGPPIHGEDKRHLVVGTKSDLATPKVRVDLALSATTGEGMTALLDRVRSTAERLMTGAGDANLTRERHRVVLTDAAECLERAMRPHLAVELVAEELRLALRHLGRMTGAVDVEDVLDRIFASFCIGK